jgi:hypothetical protein
MRTALVERPIDSSALDSRSRLRHTIAIDRAMVGDESRTLPARADSRALRPRGSVTVDIGARYSGSRARGPLDPALER